MDGRYVGHCGAKALFAASGTAWVSPEARIEAGAVIEGPCFIDEGAVVKAGARIGPYSVVGRQCHIEEHAAIDHAILWANTRVSQEAIVRQSILGRHCHIGRNALVDAGVVLGDKSVLTDYSRL
jgi:NDP-sugar pyrophosphorylase family protein